MAGFLSRPEAPLLGLYSKDDSWRQESTRVCLIRKRTQDGQDQGTGMEPTKRGLVVNGSESDGITFLLKRQHQIWRGKWLSFFLSPSGSFFLIYDGNEDDGSSLSYYCRFFFRLLVVFVG